MKLYTKGGDKGRTSLVGGERVSKASAVVEAYGTLDELSAVLGLMHDQYLVDTEYSKFMQMIVGRVMDCSAVAAGAPGAIPQRAIEQIEQQIDLLQSKTPPIEQFTLPMGYAPTSSSHVCRTVCRRAERRVIALENERYASVQIYLNRLSDYLYALGRALMEEEQGRGAAEILWRSDLELEKI